MVEKNRLNIEHRVAACFGMKHVLQKALTTENSSPDPWQRLAFVYWTQEELTVPHETIRVFSLWCIFSQSII